jgi:hypothetical protein
MSRTSIVKNDGTSTRYFWMEADGSAPSRKTVYKQTTDGVKRMRGVHFDSATNRIHKHA